MPELPEVETIRVGLAALLPGRQIAAVDYDWPKGFPNSSADVDKFLIGAEVVTVARRAKVLLIELDSKYSLVIHLKMTGQLVFDGAGQHFGAGHPSESLTTKLPDKSTRVTLAFTDGSRLFFNDQRKFGWMRLLPTPEVPNIDFMKKMGPEPLEADFTWQILRDRLQRRQKTSVKAAILDQSVIAGIGNIYADESLWLAKIHPAKLVKDLKAADIRSLHQAIQEVLKLAIKSGGSTDRNYVDANGNKGSYLTYAKVFRREGQPCLRCGREVIKIKAAGRGTHLCSYCQQLVIPKG